MNGTAGQFLRQSLFTIDTSCLIGICRYEAGIDTKALASNQSLVNAALQDDLKEMPEYAAVTKAPVTVRGKRGMIWDSTCLLAKYL